MLGGGGGGGDLSMRSAALLNLTNARPRHDSAEDLREAIAELEHMREEFMKYAAMDSEHSCTTQEIAGVGLVAVGHIDQRLGLLRRRLGGTHCGNS